MCYSRDLNSTGAKGLNLFDKFSGPKFVFGERVNVSNRLAPG